MDLEKTKNIGRKLFNKIINHHRHRRYVFSKSYSCRGWVGRKGKYYINQVRMDKW